MEKVHSTEKLLNSVISRASRCKMLSRRIGCSSSPRMSVGFSDVVVVFLCHGNFSLTACLVLYNLDFICFLLFLEFVDDLVDVGMCRLHSLLKPSRQLLVLVLFQSWQWESAFYQSLCYIVCELDTVFSVWCMFQCVQPIVFNFVQWQEWQSCCTTNKFVDIWQVFLVSLEAKLLSLLPYGFAVVEQASFKFCCLERLYCSTA